MMELESIPSVFGRQVRRMRLQQAYTQAELAERAGISVTTLIKIEAGNRQPHPPTVRKVARALGVKPTELTVDRGA